jgi:hypothetical protein
MAEAIYLLCAATSLACTLLLIRGYVRTRARILLWASLCFVGLALNNALLFVDLVLLPSTVNLAMVRGAVALAGMLPLVVGLVWES